LAVYVVSDVASSTTSQPSEQIMKGVIKTPIPQDIDQAPEVTAWNTVASYASYGEAQDAVDGLATLDFPIGELEIVGSGLRSVERVTGPMTWKLAALGGAGAGAWTGLFVGLLVGLFTNGGVWLGLLLGGLLIGAAWGALLALTFRGMSRGQHNFSSLRSVVATRYDVIARDGLAVQARVALGLG
jgi:hypothetical protein